MRVGLGITLLVLAAGASAKDPKKVNLTPRWAVGEVTEDKYEIRHEVKGRSALSALHETEIVIREDVDAVEEAAVTRVRRSYFHHRRTLVSRAGRRLKKPDTKVHPLEGRWMDFTTSNGQLRAVHALPKSPSGDPIVGADWERLMPRREVAVGESWKSGESRSMKAYCAAPVACTLLKVSGKGEGVVARIRVVLKDTSGPRPASGRGTILFRPATGKVVSVKLKLKHAPPGTDPTHIKVDYDRKLLPSRSEKQTEDLVPVFRHGRAAKVYLLVRRKTETDARTTRYSTAIHFLERQTSVVDGALREVLREYKDYDESFLSGPTDSKKVSAGNLRFHDTKHPFLGKKVLFKLVDGRLQPEGGAPETTMKDPILAYDGRRLLPGRTVKVGESWKTDGSFLVRRYSPTPVECTLRRITVKGKKRTAEIDFVIDSPPASGTGRMLFQQPEGFVGMLRLDLELKDPDGSTEDLQLVAYRSLGR